MADQFSPGMLIDIVKALTVTGLLVGVVLLILKEQFVPGSIYRRAVADIELKDKVIDRLTLAVERLTSKLNKKGMQ